MLEKALVYLKNIPDSNLIQCIGEETANAIKSYNLIHKDSYTTNYAHILLSQRKERLFFDRDAYRNIILFLPDECLQKVVRATGISGNNLEQSRIILSKKRFGYQNAKFSSSLLDALNLDSTVFFAEYDSLDSKEPTSSTTPRYSLHSYQKNLKNKAIRYLLNPTLGSRILIHMPTGAGKTKTAMEVLSDYIRARSVLGGFDQSFNVVWLAHSKELCEQAEQSFTNTWELRGDSTVDVFRLYGSYSYSENLLASNHAIVFASFQKFYSLLNSSHSLQRSIVGSIINKVKLVIVDEAHKSMARTYHRVIQTLCEKSLGVQLLGLTATPGRSSDEKDDSNKYLAEFYQSNKIGLVDEIGRTVDNSIEYLQKLGVLACLERNELLSEVQVQLNDEQIKNLNYFGDSKLSEILGNLAVHPGRNKLIVDKLRSLYLEGQSVLVFACTANHCIILNTLLSEYDINSAFILGETPKKEREQTIIEFKSGKVRILINYGVLTTGFDAPNLNAVLIARPTTSLVLYSQMVGRALRGPLNGGNEVNTLIDIRDNFDLGTESDLFKFYDDFWN